MVRAHISSQVGNGGKMIDGRSSFSGVHFGKGMTSFSGGHVGKGQITSASQLGMFGVGSEGTREQVAMRFDGTGVGTAEHVGSEALRAQARTSCPAPAPAPAPAAQSTPSLPRGGNRTAPQPKEQWTNNNKSARRTGEKERGKKEEKKK